MIIIPITKFNNNYLDCSNNFNNYFFSHNKDCLFNIRYEDFIGAVIIPFGMEDYKSIISEESLKLNLNFSLYEKKIINDQSFNIIHKNIKYIEYPEIKYIGKVLQYLDNEGNKVLKHGDGSLYFNKNELKGTFQNGNLVFNKIYKLNLTNGIKMEFEIFNDNDNISFKILTTYIPIPNYKENCNTKYSKKKLMNYYEKWINENINNHELLIKFVLDQTVNYQSPYYNYYFNILKNSPLSYLIYFKSFKSNKTYDDNDFIFGFVKDHDIGMNLLGYLILNLKWLNELFVEKYKRSFCIRNTKHNPYTCGTFSHQEDPDKNYLDTYLPIWRDKYLEIKEKGFDINILLKDYISELTEYDRSKYSPLSSKNRLYRSPSSIINPEKEKVYIPKLQLPMSSTTNEFDKFTKKNYSTAEFNKFSSKSKVGNYNPNGLCLSNKRSISDSFIHSSEESIKNNNELEFNSFDNKSEIEKKTTNNFVISHGSNEFGSNELLKNLFDLLKKKDEDLVNKDKEVVRLTLRNELLSDKVTELTQKVLAVRINEVKIQDKYYINKIKNDGINSIKEFEAKRNDDKLKIQFQAEMIKKLQNQINHSN